jgi:hypothetical protein
LTVNQAVRLTGCTLATLLAGCAIGASGSFPSTAVARQATDVPATFSSPHGGEAPGRPCRTPLHDPRDSTAVVLVRSASGVGDYEVPPGRYGVGDRELLRLECGTGRVVGIVPR